MGNPMLWYHLGVKQQENERERNAIKALRRAIELDPSCLEAWLALATSYSNEGDRNGAYDAIENWIRNNGRYDAKFMMPEMDQSTHAAVSEKHQALLRCLLDLTRAAPNGEVDADIQTALGVLLNTSEVTSFIPVILQSF
jgi:peroxin-5